MRWTLVAALACVLLGGATPRAIIAQDSYVKIEIKGVLNASNLSYGGPFVSAESLHYTLGPKPVTKPGMTHVEIQQAEKRELDRLNKRLKSLDGEVVIVRGGLTLEKGASPRITVNSIRVVPRGQAK